MHSKNYSFLDKFLLSSFLHLVASIKEDKLINVVSQDAFNKYAHLNEIFHLNVENAFLNRLLFLIRG